MGGRGVISMGQRLDIHPVTPQQRFLERAGKVLQDHGVVVIPTDSCYALAMIPGSHAALTRIAQIKGINPDKHLFSMIVPDLSDVARYALVETQAYRILRRFLPGPYTFILPASRETPRILLSRRKTIGLRVPGHPVPLAVARAAGGAIMATTVKMQGEEFPISDPDEIEDRVIKHVDLFLSCGWGGVEPSTLIDLSGHHPEVLRAGAGDPSPFQ